MTRVSTKITSLLAILAVLGTTAYSQTPAWPLKTEIDLSSGYGDMRSGRFHVGLDLRTGGRIGVRVYAPVDGYVWRVKMAYLGYGKGLYLRGNDGHIYVFGHLNGFNEAIEQAVRNEQFRKERYFVELTFPADSLPVKKGDLIAYSGQTGSGAPHLHFEKRTSDNLPVNPLKHGFELDDRVAPTFERVGVQLLDDHSLFTSGRRKMFVPARRVAAGKYRLERPLAMDAPFGFLVDGYDQMRAGGMKQAIHRLSLFVDSVLYYESSLDTLPFEMGVAVGLVFDPVEAANGEKRVRRLFRPVSEDLIWTEIRSGYGGRAFGSGGYGVESPGRIGSHQVLVVAEDVSGNRSELRFTFEYGEPGMKGSAVQHPDYEYPDSSTPVMTEFQILEDGLIAKVKSAQSSKQLFFRPVPPHVSFLNQSQLLLHRLIAGMMGKGTTIDVVGWNGGRSLESTDGRFVLDIPDGALFRTQFASVTTVDPPVSSVWKHGSDLYLVKPQTTLLKRNFGVRLRLDSAAMNDPRAGLCWCAEIGDNWVWIDRGNRGDSLAEGSSSGGGLFGVISDQTPPSVSALNLQPGHKYADRQPQVRFTVRDNLSGIEDDRALDVRIDGRWLLPELDMETGRCVATLPGQLELGKHVLTITVTDRAGNRTEKRVEFETIRGSKR